MEAAKEELERAGQQAKAAQSVESRLAGIKGELNRMNQQLLEVRVQAAVASTRLVRLDNPILAARLESLKSGMLELMHSP